MIPKTQMWVHPDFKRKLKAKAADNDKKIIEFTKDLSGDMDQLDCLFKKKKNVRSVRFF